MNLSDSRKATSPSVSTRATSKDLILEAPVQGIETLAFDPVTLPQKLALIRPKFAVDDRHLTQLAIILKHAGSLGCRSVAIEKHYIDRDYMEDHSVFYSKNLRSFPNHCQRLHFFSSAADELAAELSALRRLGVAEGRERYHAACEEFARRAYLGFTVLKPLPGSPVGRTVLRPPPDEDTDLTIRFPCKRRVPVHFAGISLSVEGLAFQQQDTGVSACATTALWSSFGMMRHMEEFGTSTPAQITSLAAKYSLPFGRAFPSEGLSIDQMCQAVQAVSLSPNLFRFTSAELTLSYLHSATKSAVAPIVVMKSVDKPLLYHAVCVAGMGVRKEAAGGEIVDRGRRLTRIYIHDDRFGPYLHCNLVIKQTSLVAYLQPIGHKEERWNITHVLIPMPPKVRLSFSGLRELANVVAVNARAFATAESISESGAVGTTRMEFESWVSRSHTYLESLLWVFGGEHSAERSATLARSVALSRYLGVVRLRGWFFGVIDVLIDTTSTRRSPHCLAVVVRDPSGNSARLAEFLSNEYACPMIP